MTINTEFNEDEFITFINSVDLMVEEGFKDMNTFTMIKVAYAMKLINITDYMSATAYIRKHYPEMLANPPP